MSPGIGIGPALPFIHLFRRGGGATPASYLQSDGLSGSVATVAHNAALNVTGDIDVRVAVALDDWSSGAIMQILAKEVSSFANYSQFVYANAGIGFEWRGAVYFNEGQFTSSPEYSDGQLVLLRHTIDIDNGAGGYDVTFFSKTGVAVGDVHTEIEANTGWATVNADTVTASGAETALSANTIDLTLFADDGDARRAAGKMYRAIVMSGISGTAVLDIDPRTASPGDSSLTDSASGLTLTLSGGVTLV